MKVKDIYYGKPDARYEKIETFNDTYMVFPSLYDMDKILTNDTYYLIGNKGTGKTAFLLYIGNKLIEMNKESICSTILFKTEYDNSDRIRVETLNKQILQTMDLSSESKNDISNYVNIWKLTLYVKIIIDNQNSNFTIFKETGNWNSFVDLTTRLADVADIKATDDLRLMSEIPKFITIDLSKERWNIEVSDNRIPIPEDEDAIELIQFNRAMKYVDKLFASLTRTSVPYCMCIDELETSVSCKNYLRDLQMIHDWMEVVWYFNTTIKNCKYSQMKVILSVRQEIVQGIERQLVGDEINKKRLSYSQKIDWKYTQDNIGIHTPLIQIMLKKIMISSPDDKDKNYDDVLNKWFPTSIGDESICDFIFHRTWGKPRDIVRFLYLAVQNARNQEIFDKSLLIGILYEYSYDSRTEIEEEMSAAFSREDIKNLFFSVENFKESFSKDEYFSHVKAKFPNNLFMQNVNNVLNILFMYGIIGCNNNKQEKTNWAYKGDTFASGMGWRYVIHPGLMQVLHYEVAEIQGLNYYDIKGVTYTCTIVNTKKQYLDVQFTHNGKNYTGFIHVRELNLNEYVENLQNDSRFTKNNKIRAFVTGYNFNLNKWRFKSNANFIFNTI